MIVIPAIDIIDGNCVRLTRGEKETKKVYDADPAEAARRFVDAGAKRIHVVDLDGAFEGGSKNLQSIARIAKLGVPIEVGGGIRSYEAVRALIEVGARYIVLGTLVIEDPSLAAEIIEAHPDRIYIGIDARAGLVATRGWERTTERTTDEIAERAAEWKARGIIFTAIERDGELVGPDFEAIEELANDVEVPIIASGGVTTMDDLRELARIGSLEGAIVGKALYEGRIKIDEALAVE